jgi:hypothetical protein
MLTRVSMRHCRSRVKYCLGDPRPGAPSIRALWRVAPIPVTVPNHDEGATGPSPLGTGEESVPFELNRRLSRLFCR